MGCGGNGYNILRAVLSPEGGGYITTRAVKPEVVQTAPVVRRVNARCGIIPAVGLGGRWPCVRSAVIHGSACGAKKMQLRAGGSGLAHKFGIIGAYKAYALGGKIGEQARFVPGHALAAKTLGMTGADVKYKANVRAHDGRQFFHVALMADASLHDPKIFIAVSGEHGAGHADLVVVVQGVLGGFAAHGKHLSQHFLERCLARSARNAHYFGGCFVAPHGGDAAKGLDRIFHHQHWHTRTGQSP